MSANERTKREYERGIYSNEKSSTSSTDRNILNKIFIDLERSEKTDNQRLEDKTFEEFQ